MENQAGIVVDFVNETKFCCYKTFIISCRTLSHISLDAIPDCKHESINEYNVPDAGHSLNLVGVKVVV